MSTKPVYGDVAQCVATGIITKLTCTGSPSWASALGWTLATSSLEVCLAKGLNA